MTSKRIVRESRFRHLSGELWKQKHDGLRVSTKGTDGCGVRGNRKWIAFPWQSGGGGVLAVLDAEKPERS